jgi:integrase
VNSAPTVAEWLEGYRELFPGRSAPATLKHDAYMLAPFAQRYGRKRLDEIGPLDAQRWAVKHPGQVRYLRQAFSKALLMGLVPLNVWRVVELPPRTIPPRPVPTASQLEAIIARCCGRGGWWLEYADLLIFAAHTGARSAGVAGLRRSEVDLPLARVVLCEKGAKVRRVAVPRRAANALERQLERHPWTDLVWRAQARGPLDKERIGEAWRAVRGDFPGPFHSLKHYCATWLAAQGVDERDIAVQLGHTDSEGRPYPELLRRIYVHPNHEDALARIALACDGDGL